MQEWIAAENDLSQTYSKVGDYISQRKAEDKAFMENFVHIPLN